MKLWIQRVILICTPCLGLLFGGCPTSSQQPSGDDPHSSEDQGDQTPTGGLLGSPQLAMAEFSRLGDSGTLRWSEVSGATLYTLYFGAGDKPVQIAELVTSQYSISGLLTCTDYSWYVVATGPSGTGTSVVQRFRTPCSTDTPAPAGQPQPPDGALEQIPTVTLKWASVSAVTHYDVYFGNQPSPPIVGRTADTKFEELPFVFGNEQYYWRVVAWNEKGGTSSPTWRFETMGNYDDPNASPPAPAKLVAPRNGDMTVGFNPELAWAPSFGAEWYDIYLSETDPPTFAVRTTETQLRLPETLTPLTSYRWQVVAVNRYGRTPSDIRAFLTLAEDNSPGTGSGSEQGGGQPVQRSDCVLAARKIPLPGDALRFGRLSANGSVVAFISYQDGLVDGDRNGDTDAFVYEFETGRIERVSIGTSGAPGNSASWGAYPSADGQRVIFSTIRALDPNDRNNGWDVYLRNRATQTTSWVSKSPGGASAAMGISADGRTVAYGQPDRVRGHTDFYVVDVDSGTTEQVNLTSLGSVMSTTWWCVLSGDGRFVAMRVDDGGVAQVALRDRQTQTTIYVSDREIDSAPLHVSDHGEIVTFYDVYSFPAEVFAYETASSTRSALPLAEHGFDRRFVIVPWHLDCASDGSLISFPLRERDQSPVLRRYARLTNEFIDFPIESQNEIGKVNWGALGDFTGGRFYFEADDGGDPDTGPDSAWIADCP